MSSIPVKILICAALLLCSAGAGAARVSATGMPEGYLDMGPYWEARAAAPNRVELPPPGAPYQRLSEHPELLASAQAFWLRATLVNDTQAPLQRLLELDNPLLGRVELLAVAPGRALQRERSGLRIPMREKKLRQPQPVLPLEIPAGSELELYLYVQTADQVRVPARLWQPAQFYAQQLQRTFVSAAGLGIILVMALYNLLISAITRDRTYLKLGAFIASLLFLMLVLQGWAGTYLWPNVPSLTAIAIGPALALTLWALHRFSQRFLAISHDGWQGRLINVVCSINLIMAVWLALVPSWPLAAVLMAVNVPAGMIPLARAWRLWRDRNREGLYFLLAIAPIAAVLPFALLNRLLEWHIDTATVQASMLIAASLLSISLGIVLSLRIRRMNAERDAAYQHLVRAERHARESQSRAEVAARDNRAKSAFLATMSHEIRTPMNGVLGMADLLKSTELDHQQTYYLATLVRSGHALMDILNDVLDYSKVESGKLELELVETDLIELLDDLTVPLREQLTRKALGFTLFLHPDVPRWIQTDPTRLKQVLSNLLNNAVKFTEKGDITLSVDHPGPDRLLFSISDEGIGMDAQTRERLFSRFEQADSSISRRYGGTGLGLAISRSLVELFDGEIHVDSQPGRGSTFSFDIRFEPCQRQEPSPSAACLCVLSRDERLMTMLRLLALRWNMPFRPLLDSERTTLETLGPQDVLLTDSEVPAPVQATVLQLDSAGLGRPPAISELFNALDGCHAGATSNGASAVGQPLTDLEILVAEDNPTNRLVVGKILSGWGASVRFADNGLEARDMVASDHAGIHLVVMDCEMPEMDGYSATEAIRSLEAELELPELPIVALTAHVLPEFREKAMAAGMSDYITKPVNRDLLLNTILQLTATDRTAARHSL